MGRPDEPLSKTRLKMFSLAYRIMQVCKPDAVALAFLSSLLNNLCLEFHLFVRLKYFYDSENTLQSGIALRPQHTMDAFA